MDQDEFVLVGPAVRRDEREVGFPVDGRDVL